MGAFVINDAIINNNLCVVRERNKKIPQRKESRLNKTILGLKEMLRLSCWVIRLLARVQFLLVFVLIR